MEKHLKLLCIKLWISYGSDSPFQTEKTFISLVSLSAINNFLYGWKQESQP